MKVFYRFANYFLGVLIIGFIGTSRADAQKLKLNAFLDHPKIMIGDQLHFTIEVEQPQNARIIFPAFKDSITSHIEIVAAEPADTLKKGNIWSIKKEYVITSFDSGYHKIPSFSFPVKFDQVNDTISSQELFLTVNTLHTDTAKSILDIKPLMETPFKLSEIKKEILIGLLILLLLGIGIWVFIRIRKNKPIFTAPKPVDPPHVVALKSLDYLRSEKPWQSKPVKFYYTQLTDILRLYIDGRYQINAMEMTTDEIISALLTELNQDQELKTAFSKLLVLSDLVKFAKEEPLPQDNESALLSAYLFVNRTKIEIVKPLSESDIKNQNESDNQA